MLSILEVKEDDDTPDDIVLVVIKFIAPADAVVKPLGVELKVMDLGGGLGIPYDFTSESLNFSEVHELLVKLKNKYKLNKVWMELGRYTVGECGYYFTKIVDKKEVKHVGLEGMSREQLEKRLSELEGKIGEAKNIIDVTPKETS